MSLDYLLDFTPIFVIGFSKPHMAAKVIFLLENLPFLGQRLQKLAYKKNVFYAEKTEMMCC
jgi:hypothetical protein